jgi:hypothetical protein
MIRVFVQGIGLLGPGLDGWLRGRQVLAEEVPYKPGPIQLPVIGLLPAAERRRAGYTVRLAIAVGLESLTQSGCNPVDMAMVFAASGGDGATNHETLEVLASVQREVSPTRFHNSVHNAPSGYWAVATGSRAPSSSLCAFDGTFAAGFLEAAVQAAVDHRPVTLIAYDTPYPEPLGSVRRIGSVFAVALVLAPHRTSKSLAALTLEVEGSGSHEAGMADADLERLRIGNPAARALPLLAALATLQSASVGLSGLRITVTRA